MDQPDLFSAPCECVIPCHELPAKMKELSALGMFVTRMDVLKHNMGYELHWIPDPERNRHTPRTH